MKRNYRLLFGPLAGAILGFGIGGLALLIPGYSHVHQTVSEIGEIGSPARVPFAIMLCCVAACILVFASAVRDLSVMAHHSRLAAYLIGFMALWARGSWSLRLPASTSQRLRPFRVDWLPSTTGLGADMETRATGKTSCLPLVDPVCGGLRRNRSELEFA